MNQLVDESADRTKCFCLFIALACGREHGRSCDEASLALFTPTKIIEAEGGGAEAGEVSYANEINAKPRMLDELAVGLTEVIVDVCDWV